MTISELAKEFAEIYMKRKLRPSTARGYTVNIEQHILPTLGEYEIEDITVDDLDELTALLSADLSNRSIVYTHATLRKMINYALRRGYCENTPYTAFDMPRVEKYRFQILKESEIKYALMEAEGTTLEIPLSMALCYGLRRGEILGLIPAKDLDIHNNTLHIQRTRSVEYGKTVITPCKTENSNRFILLSQKHAEMLAFAAGYYAYPYTPSVLNSSFKKFLKQNDLPDIRFHDLRHSYATYMLSKGINPKIVCAVMGHSSVKVTLDIYSHPDVSMQKVCVDLL